MKHAIARVLVLLAALMALPAIAQTRAWLDRAEITYGETTTLNIQTDQSLQQVDYAPLQRQFDIAGQTVRRSFEMTGGQSRRTSRFTVGIRPRGPGVLTIPGLRVGNATTAPLRLTVLPPSVQPANGDADVFVETAVDAGRPYVQQAVGVVVRLHYAVSLLSGQLDLDAPAGASLQRVGEDVQYQREVGGRRYDVVERRFLLIPERSGELLLPGARFNGMTAGGFFDQVFDDGRKPLSAASPAKRLQVQPIPAAAPQPWLPLHDLRLRYAQLPKQAKVGEAATVEIEAIVDGATAAQLPAIALGDAAGVQVFAEPQQADEQFVDGRPTTILRRRISLVPQRAGELVVPGPRVEWWDAVKGEPRTASLPPVRLQVAPGAAAAGAPDGDTAPVIPSDGVAPSTRAKTEGMYRWLWGLFGIAVIAALCAWWWRDRVSPASRTAASEAAPQVVPHASGLTEALKAGELAGIAHALCVEAGLQAGNLDGVRDRLDDAGQVRAVEALQAARWGSGDTAGALAALRNAFAKGARWRSAGKPAAMLLPPLYPE